MKLIIHFLLSPAFFLSACAAGISQEVDTQPQLPPPQSEQTARVIIKRPPPLYRSQTLWGGFPLQPNYQSQWGGFSLDPTTASTSTEPLSKLPCELTEDFYVIQHRYPFLRPFSHPFNTEVDSSYRYGTTQFGERDPHHGVEIINPTGAPVLAVEDGIVVIAGNDGHSIFGPWENFYGILVVLMHQLPEMEEPVFSLYGHLSDVDVKVGQTVRRGQLIGEVGATGTAIGSHLHFEVRVGTNTYANTRNPELWLFPRRDENDQLFGALAGNFCNAKGDSIYLTVKAQYYSDLNGPPSKTYSIETYAPDKNPLRGDEFYQENFVLNDLPPGYYRIALNTSGQWTERWVEVEPGKLSFVTIVVQ